MGLAYNYQFQTLQDFIGALIYSDSGICFNSIHGKRRSVLSTSVNSLTPLFNRDGSLFGTHSFASGWDCPFRWRVCSFDSFSLFAWVKKNCSSAISEEDIVSSMDVVCMSLQILRGIFSVTLSSSLARESQLLCWLNRQCEPFWN